VERGEDGNEAEGRELEMGAKDEDEDEDEDEESGK